MTTNGSQAAPSRDRIIATAAYYAAIEGHYDTSEAAQKSNLLSISVVDMASVVGDPLPPGATHRLYVMINATGYMVTRYATEFYQVAPHDRMERQREERELRDAVLDAALWHLTGEGAGYRPGTGDEARTATIKELLVDGPEGAEPAPRESSDPFPHPVIREEEPDLAIFLAPAGEGQELPRPLRQWVVEIGPYHRCTVLFFGYRVEDGEPELITHDREDDSEDEEEE